MKTRALLVGHDARLAEWLTRFAGDQLEVNMALGDDLAAVTAEFEHDTPPKLVFVEFATMVAAERATLVERLNERFNQIPVAGISAVESSDLVLSAVRAGARDFFVPGRDDGTVSSHIGRMLQRVGGQPVADAAPAGRGRIFTLLGGHPHEGIAFLGEHLALALNETKTPRSRILLLDLATPAGAATVFLNINQTYSVLDAIRDAHRCDETLIDTAFSKHSSGIHVLSVPEDLMGMPEFDPREMLRLVRVLRTLFAFVIITLDGHLPLEAVAELISLSDRSLVLSDQSILKSRHTNHLMRALRARGCELERTGLVVDNYRKKLGLEPRNLAELLDLPLVATLHTEDPHRIIAMNSGEPLFAVAKRDPYCTAVRELAQTLQSQAASLGQKPVAPGAKRRWLGG